MTSTIEFILLFKYEFSSPLGFLFFSCSLLFLKIPNYSPLRFETGLSQQYLNPSTNLIRIKSIKSNQSKCLVEPSTTTESLNPTTPLKMGLTKPTAPTLCVPNPTQPNPSSTTTPLIKILVYWLTKMICRALTSTAHTKPQICPRPLVETTWPALVEAGGRESMVRGRE